MAVFTGNNPSRISGMSSSGTRFLPFQQNAYEQGSKYALGQLPGVGDYLNQPFANVLGEVGGPAANFTDIPESAYLTPDVLDNMVNAMFGQAAGRTAAQQEAIREGVAPGAGTGSGFGITEQLAAAQRFNDAVAARNETTLRGEYAPSVNRQAAVAQTNVEAQRAADDRNRRLLALTRFRDLMSRENALLGQLSNFGQPLRFSESTSYSNDRRPTVRYPIGHPARTLV